MTSNKILVNNCERVGIRDTTAIQKADGFLRILNSTPAAKTISDAAKIILCIDLAATSLGLGFDKETAVKLAGLRKTVYQNSYNILEKILNLDKQLTISELCVQFSCTEAIDTAEKILKGYKEHDTKIKDISHPQYVAAAVYTSCKLNGIRVDKTQFRVTSRLKVAQWNELTEEFTKFATSLGLTATKKRGRKKGNVEEQDELMESEDLAYTEPKIKEKEGVVEEYEVWRERILREARDEIIQRETEKQ